MLKRKNLVYLILVLAMFIFDSSVYAIKRANLVFLGEIGSGKTTVMDLLIGKKISGFCSHTLEFKSIEKDIKIPGFLSNTEVGVNLIDTVAEEYCRDALNKWYPGAVQIAILCVDATVASNYEYGYTSSKRKMLEDTLHNLWKNSKECRVIIVLTKTGDSEITTSAVNRAINYVNKELIGTKLKSNVEGGFIEFPDLEPKTLQECKKVLEERIIRALKSYGLKNLKEGTNAGMIPELIKNPDTEEPYYRSVSLDVKETYDAGGCDGEKTRTRKVTKYVPATRRIDGGYRIETNK